MCYNFHFYRSSQWYQVLFKISFIAIRSTSIYRTSTCIIVTGLHMRYLQPEQTLLRWWINKTKLNAHYFDVFRHWCYMTKRCRHLKIPRQLFWALCMSGHLALVLFGLNSYNLPASFNRQKPIRHINKYKKRNSSQYRSKNSQATAHKDRSICIAIHRKRYKTKKKKNTKWKSTT